MTAVIDLRGRVFGRLIVVSRAENDGDGQAMWLCHCSCGNSKKVRSKDLRQGKVTSCRCLQREVTVHANGMVEFKRV